MFQIQNKKAPVGMILGVDNSRAERHTEHADWRVFSDS